MGQLLLSIWVVYTFFYIFPFPFTFIGVFGELGNFYREAFWAPLIQFIGKSILGITEAINTTPGGSGDTTYDWIHALLVLIFALVLGPIWYFVFGKRTPYKTVKKWSTVYIVYFLIFSMIVYGMVKVIKLQFPDPSLARLLQPYGHSSPMGIAWTFMGASDSYTFFAGASELVGGLLLLFRRTRTFGALVTMTVVLNIFMMNMSYDIPVKLYSFHLLIFATYIAFTDWRRLLNLFLLNKPTSKAEKVEYTQNSKVNKGITVFKFVAISAFLIYSFTDALSARSLYGEKRPIPPLYGIYEVVDFVKNGEEHPPLLTDRERWRWLLIDKGNYGILMFMNDYQTRYHSLEIDTVEQKLMMREFADSTRVYDFSYSEEGEFLNLEGEVRSNSLELKLKKHELENFLLVSRGFHWVNEYPFNR